MSGYAPTKQHLSGASARPELRLLLACAAAPQEMDHSAVRNFLQQKIDWTAFARMAVAQDVAGLAGSVLAGVAPDLIPEDMLDAFRRNAEHIRQKNLAGVVELRRLALALERGGARAISFSGPVLGTRAYGDPAFRSFGEPRFLIRGTDITTAMAILQGCGYDRQRRLTAAQLDIIRHLQGGEKLSNRERRIGAHICTRVTPLKLMFELDHEALWRRATSTPADGEFMRTLAPEDELLILATNQYSDLYAKIGWTCDVAGLIAGKSNLNWVAILERARAQGCLRVVLLAASLARMCLNAKIPDIVVRAECADPVVVRMASRAIQRWKTGEFRPAPANKEHLKDLLMLHDGVTARTGYVARSVFLPEPAHVSRIPLPAWLSKLSVYIVLKIAQEAAMLPLLRAYRKLRGSARYLRDALASHELGMLLVPVEQRLMLRRHNAARIEAERLLAANPGNAAAWQKLGDALVGLKHYQAAIACYDSGLAVSPESLLLWSRRAAVMRACGQSPDDAAIAEDGEPDPTDADAWARQAAFLAFLKRFPEAVAAADHALALNPRQLVATRVGIRSRILSCDWRRRLKDELFISEGLRAGAEVTTPSGNRAVSDSEAQNLRVARLWIRPFLIAPETAVLARTYCHDRIRIAYLCSDYHDGHPAGRGVVELFEHHDKRRFDTTAISLGGSNDGAVQRRIQAACQRFISVHDKDDQQAAAIIRDLEIDIAIDLDRLSGRARPGILAQRPAVLQISYYGNAGTTGAPFFDYIIADRTLIPREHACHYTEKIIYLPNSYQCNDAHRSVPHFTPSRREAGLPETGFVYCCFNNNYKLNPTIFEVWMRLLRDTPNSVLWLLSSGPYAEHNLRREAAARGVAPERIVFAPPVSNQEHLARHRVADLFLDTLPCNAHATASDALWAGLPILTCLGQTFAGRVGGSLLRAVGLPELVTETLTQYEERALALARDPKGLAAIRAKLARNRESTPLFDTARLSMDLESAYIAVWRRQQAGLTPDTLVVPPATTVSD